MSTKIFTPASNLHETGGTLAVPNWPFPVNATEDWEQLIQMLLDRGKVGSDGVTALQAIAGPGTNIKLTPEGGLAIRMINRTGGASVLGNVVTPYMGWVVTPGSTTLSNMVGVVGASPDNTHAGRLYLAVSIPGGLATVSAYKDSARTELVAEGALADNTGGTVSLTQENASGLSFDIDIEADAAAADDAYVTLGASQGVALTDTSAINQTGVIYESGVADEAPVWVVVAGKAYVSMRANTAITCGSALITSAASAGHVDELFAADATKAQRLVGWALERKVTADAVGTIFCQLALRQTWGVAA